MNEVLISASVTTVSLLLCVGGLQFGYWIKKKTRRPFENVRAQALEDLLIGKGLIRDPKSGIYQAPPDLRNRPEVAGSEAKGERQGVIDFLRLVDTCSSLEERQRLVQSWSDILFARLKPTTHTPPPPASPTSQ